jgi:hypothetical protein
MSRRGVGLKKKRKEKTMNAYAKFEMKEAVCGDHDREAKIVMEVSFFPARGEDGVSWDETVYVDFDRDGQDLNDSGQLMMWIEEKKCDRADNPIEDEEEMLTLEQRLEFWHWFFDAVAKHAIDVVEVIDAGHFEGAE